MELKESNTEKFFVVILTILAALAMYYVIDFYRNIN